MMDVTQVLVIILLTLLIGCIATIFAINIDDRARQAHQKCLAQNNGSGYVNGKYKC